MLAKNILLGAVAALSGCAAIADPGNPPPNDGSQDPKHDDSGTTLPSKGDDAGDAAVLETSTSSADYRQTVLDDSPSAYLRLGEASGQTADEEVSSGPAAKYSGALTLGQAGALANDPNTAVSLAGGWVSLGDVLPFDATSSFSLEAWVSFQDTGKYEMILSKRDYDATSQELDGYSLFVTPDDHVCVQRWAGTGADNAYDSACSAAQAAGSYAHVVAAYDGTTLSLFIDGALVAATPSSVSIPPTTSPLRVGSDAFFPSSFTGQVDEVALYDHALEPSRVALHYKIGSGI